jgi:hypothetical protein
MINSLAMVIEQSTAEGRFCTFSARYPVLLRCQLFAPFLVGFLNFGYRDGGSERSARADKSHRHALARRRVRCLREHRKQKQ